ncbi:MAG: type II secretion system minor pseudopilin GspK [Thermodesulfobacteriota bacterium]
MMKPHQSTNCARQRDGEKGIVLVIVIIIIAILMILVTDLIYFTQIDTEISSNTRDEIKARYIAKSGVHVAAGTLKARPLEELTSLTAALGGQNENPDGYWAINVPYFPVGEGSVSVTVTDERSKINLNSLVSRSSNRVDRQVLTELTQLCRFLEVDDGKCSRFIPSLINWLDAPIEGAQNDQDSAGANGAFYSSLENPYMIKDGPLDTVQEIRMIDGMDDEFYSRIKDYVTVYPRDKKINFSTAPKQVIMAAIKGSAVSAVPGQGEGDEEEVDDDIAEQIADEIIEARKETPIITIQKARDIAKKVDETSEISGGLVGVTLDSGESETFNVRAVGSLGEENPTKRIIEAVLKKTRRDQEVVVDIVTWKEL